MANTYRVLNGASLLAKITNGDNTTDLVNDAVANPAQLSLEGVNGTRRLILVLDGFDAAAVADDGFVNVWTKLPEPVEIDAAGVYTPKENEALAVSMISPVGTGASAYYGATPTVAKQAAVTAPGVTSPGVAGDTCEYGYVSVAVDPAATGGIQMVLSLDFPHSLTR